MNTRAAKPLSIAELSKRISRHVKAGIKPLRNVDEYYQAHRPVPSFTSELKSSTDQAQ